MMPWEFLHFLIDVLAVVGVGILYYELIWKKKED